MFSGTEDAPAEASEGADHGPASNTVEKNENSGDTSVMTSTSTDQITFCGGLEDERCCLNRNFARVWNSLRKEFAKTVPSRRYLSGDLQRADDLVRAIREVVELHKVELVENSEGKKLLDLEKWEIQFNTDVALMADVSSFLEQAPSQSTGTANVVAL